MYLGIKAVLAKSFARIHRDNLINFGILQLVFENPTDYDRIVRGDRLELRGVAEALKGEQLLLVKNIDRDLEFRVITGMTNRQVEVVLAGGLLNYTKEQSSSQL